MSGEYFYQWLVRLHEVENKTGVKSPVPVWEFLEDFKRGEEPAGALILALDDMGQHEKAGHVQRVMGL